MSAYLQSHGKSRINGIYISQCGHKTNREKNHSKDQARRIIQKKKHKKKPKAFQQIFV